MKLLYEKVKAEEIMKNKRYLYSGVNKAET